jgi:hypothetical protein
VAALFSELASPEVKLPKRLYGFGGGDFQYLPFAESFPEMGVKIRKRSR